MGTVDSAAFLMAADQQDLWQRVNETDSDGRQPTLVTTLREHVVAHPGHPAVISATGTLSYAELANRAGRLVAALRAADRAPVAICIEPGPDQVVAVVSALLAGVPFVPLDPSLAQSAHWGRIQQACATRVLTQSWLAERMRWPAETTVVTVDTIPVDDAPDVSADWAAARPAEVMCLLADDGFDGPLTPLTDDGVSGPSADLANQFGFTADDRLLSVVSIDDRVGLSGVLMALRVGATLVVPEDIDLRTPAVWVDLARRHRVTVWHSPPALAAALVEHVDGRGDDLPETLRVALLAGEPLPVSLARRLSSVGGGHVRVANLVAGGAAALWATCHEVADAPGARGHVPGGKPLATVHVYVLNETLGLCPVWVTGRLYVGGALPTGVPVERVAVVPGTDERVQASGLLGRLLPDGSLDIVGEAATRITVAGHPVNLRDIEAALATHDAVQLAAVVPAGDGSVAFVKLAPGSAVTGAALLDHLRTRMSPYLLPQRVEPVGSFRLTRAGQVDRAALAAAAPQQSPSAPAAPGTAFAADLVARARSLAAGILGVADVEETANLLDLGASSVQIVRLAVQAEQELGIQADVEELLRFPSVAVLVSFASDSVADAAIAGIPDSAEASAGSSPEQSLILDPLERATFAAGEPGRRSALPGRPVELDPVPPATRAALARRATHRAFTGRPVALGAVGSLLASLACLSTAVGGRSKYAYPSASGLHAVQTYLVVHGSRVIGLREGAYYHDPVEHRLVPVGSGTLDASVHAWVNRDAFRSSAFSLYLVASLPAIVPMYGSRARDYCLIEAGAMLQLLMPASIDLGLGLCPVGELDAARAGAALALEADHEVVHSLLGGIPTATHDPAREADMLWRLAQLPGTGDQV